MRPPQKMIKPHMHPNSCAKCKNSGSESEGSRLYFLDTGITYDYEGNVYLCDCCLRDLVSVAEEYFTKEQVDDLLSTQVAIVERAAVITRDFDKLDSWISENLGVSLKFLKERMKESEENGTVRISTDSD